jgi:hypothetical protein
MSKIDALKAQIESLSSKEFAEIFRWITETAWEKWSKEIEDDSQAGGVNFLVREAHEETVEGKLKDL